MNPILYVGNKNYSSWSLRPWLVLTWAGIPFEERLISLGQPGYGKGRIADVLEVSPAGTVPALHAGDLRIWDSLSIAEWAAETQPEAELWPSSFEQRAIARSAVCEMHSSFVGVRRDLPMNIHRRCPQPEWPEDTQQGIARIIELWQALRAKNASGGPWLFGARSIADAFYAPVVTRFRTYSVPLPAPLEQYSTTVLTDEAFQRWEADAEPASWDRAGYPVIDALYE